MATFVKVLNLTKSIGNICKLSFSSLSRDSILHPFSFRFLPSIWSTNNFHTTPIKNDLMEFFDDKKHWGENEVKCGRAWTKDELRIKSNTDLHKLWYILLKEKNMLLTMEHECNDKMELFPSAERIDKVKNSMSNLETVVRERNKAYFELETGENGERPGKLQYNPLGIKYYYRMAEHIIPPYMNSKWFKTRQSSYGGRAVRKFLLLYRERLYNEKRKAKNRERNNVKMLLRRNPNLDRGVIKEKYPSVNVDKLIKNDETRGHYTPKI